VNEFQPTTENRPLKDKIVARIKSADGITFRAFMAMALYDPDFGYYSSQRDVLGREGDYLTSPEVSPLFGAMVGRQLRDIWQVMGSPGRFQIVEAGAGSGRLCADILSWATRAAGAFAGAIDYVLVDASAPMTERQKRVLSPEHLSDSVRWAAAIPYGVDGCVLSNELLDAMPVHRVSVANGRLREVFVIWDGERFLEELRDPSTPDLAAYFERLALLPGEGCTAEVNLEAIRWLGEAATTLARGYLLTFDYGYEAPDLFAPWRKDGTLLCFYRHNPSTDPYSRIGRQDMTAHVDFTSLRLAGEDAGLRTEGLIAQSEFLINMGIHDALSPPGEGESNLEEYYSRRRAATELLDPGGLGRVRLLVQSRGMPVSALSGLTAENGSA
jgi:SAM-dependent MidA family methyltransferase